MEDDELAGKEQEVTLKRPKPTVRILRILLILRFERAIKVMMMSISAAILSFLLLKKRIISKRVKSSPQSIAFALEGYLEKDSGDIHQWYFCAPVGATIRCLRISESPYPRLGVPCKQGPWSHQSHSCCSNRPPHYVLVGVTEELMCLQEIGRVSPRQHQQRWRGEPILPPVSKDKMASLHLEQTIVGLESVRITI